MLTFYTKSPDETIKLAKNIAKFLQKGDVLALEGTLAAGKTTFTKGIAQFLNITEAITSPTFTLISEYEGILPLYHMDMYRLENMDELREIGAEELIYGSGISVIEWSEKIADELPAKTITIKFEINTEETRKISIKNWQYAPFSMEEV